MEDPNIADGDLIPNEVEIDLHMLGPLVLDRIGGEVHRIDVVAIDQRAPGARRGAAGAKKPQPHR